MKKLTRYLLLISGLCLALSNVYANEEAEAGLVTQHESGVTYINGGIGLDQQAWLKSHRKNFNLQLMFAEKSGHYIADVDVDIKNMASGKVMSFQDMGPIFLVKLEPGQYHISVKSESGGKSQMKTVHVDKAGTKNLNFYW